MTRSLAVNTQNDLYIDQFGDLAIAVGLDAVIQNCSHAARAVLGEMVLDINRGVPYFETVFSGSPKLAQFDAALRTALLNVTDVLEITDLSFSYSNNQLAYTAIIMTTYGQGVTSGVI